MITYIVVSIVLSIIFGLTILTEIVQNKVKVSIIKSRYLYQFWSFVFFVIFYIFYNEKISFLNFDNVLNIKNLFLMCIAIIPIVLLTSFNNINKIKNKRLSEGVLGAILMEIPQRLLSQNIFFIFLSEINTILGVPVAIVLNGLIYDQFIIIQELINTRKITKKILLDTVLSFWFSIFIGLLYYNTGNILLTMISHGAIYFFRNLIKKQINNRVTID